MPLYEYKCETCGDKFEVIQKFSDQPLILHEKCGGKVERLISPPALQFKGSGWYVTDYGKGNSKDPKPNADGAKGSGKSEKSNGTSTASDSSGKSDTSSSKTDSSSTASTPGASKSDSK
jgi:putative FmdB family regulatory protein